MKGISPWPGFFESTRMNVAAQNGKSYCERRRMICSVVVWMF